MSNVPTTSIFPSNNVHKFGQYGMERDGFCSNDTNEMFMRIKFHPHSQRNEKHDMNAENIAVSHRGIGRIRLLWRRYLSRHILLN